MCYRNTNRNLKDNILNLRKKKIEEQQPNKSFFWPKTGSGIPTGCTSRISLNLHSSNKKTLPDSTSHSQTLWRHSSRSSSPSDWITATESCSRCLAKSWTNTKPWEHITSTSTGSWSSSASLTNSCSSHTNPFMPLPPSICTTFYTNTLHLRP